MLKILVIGNSFGSDSVRYLYGIARAAGKELRVVNLYIGGCSLYRHYRNMLSEEEAYDFEINGFRNTGIKISLKKALLMDEWDYIFTQQASPKSWDYESYQPYIGELAAYIRRLCPPAKLCLQMTWAYDAARPQYQTMGVHNPEEMIAGIETSYRRAAEAIDAHFLLPTGLAMYRLYKEIGSATYRDMYHANIGISRYMIGCMWFMALTGIDILDNSFADFDAPVTDGEVALAKNIARETLLENGFALREA